MNSERDKSALFDWVKGEALTESLAGCSISRHQAFSHSRSLALENLPPLTPSSPPPPLFSFISRTNFGSFRDANCELSCSYSSSNWVADSNGKPLSGYLWMSSELGSDGTRILIFRLRDVRKYSKIDSRRLLVRPTKIEITSRRCAS